MCLTSRRANGLFTPDAQSDRVVVFADFTNKACCKIDIKMSLIK